MAPTLPRMAEEKARRRRRRRWILLAVLVGAGGWYIRSRAAKPGPAMPGEPRSTPPDEPASMLAAGDATTGFAAENAWSEPEARVSPPSSAPSPRPRPRPRPDAPSPAAEPAAAEPTAVVEPPDAERTASIAESGDVEPTAEPGIDEPVAHEPGSAQAPASEAVEPASLRSRETGDSDAGARGPVTTDQAADSPVSAAAAARNGLAPSSATAEAGFGRTDAGPAEPNVLFTPPAVDDKAPASGARSGPGGQAPGPDYTIKGNSDSMLFHTPTSPYYARTKAEVWFRTPEEAAAAGFTEWTPKRRSR